MFALGTQKKMTDGPHAFTALVLLDQVNVYELPSLIGDLQTIQSCA